MNIPGTSWEAGKKTLELGLEDSVDSYIIILFVVKFPDFSLKNKSMPSTNLLDLVFQPCDPEIRQSPLYLRKLFLKCAKRTQGTRREIKDTQVLPMNKSFFFVSFIPGANQNN